MTEKEFTQRVAIALAGNPKFADYKILFVDAIIEEAQRLAEAIDKEYGSEFFDFEGEDALWCISNDLSDIKMGITGDKSDGVGNIRESLGNIIEAINDLSTGVVHVADMVEATI